MDNYSKHIIAALFGCMMFVAVGNAETIPASTEILHPGWNLLAVPSVSALSIQDCKSPLKGLVYIGHELGYADISELPPGFEAPRPAITWIYSYGPCELAIEGSFVGGHSEVGPAKAYLMSSADLGKNVSEITGSKMTYVWDAKTQEWSQIPTNMIAGTELLNQPIIIPNNH